ncbi:hypothetical protein G3M55_34045, partial [Streptomyces sp. SID8455]|nr:hypothetical protein [Streptomyces sp. SID8455]
MPDGDKGIEERRRCEDAAESPEREAPGATAGKATPGSATAADRRAGAPAE